MALITCDAFPRRERPVVGQARRRTRPWPRARPSATSSSCAGWAPRSRGREGRDLWWHELARRRSPASSTRDARRRASTRSCSPTRPGTTGRPKGAVHVHGGFLVKIACGGRLPGRLPARRPPALGDRHRLDHGPVAARRARTASVADVLLYDGAPDYPDAGRLWRLVERHRLTFLGVSPTLVRALEQHGDDAARRGSTSPALRLFGSTGEPWNPEPYLWLFDAVGGGTRPDHQHLGRDRGRRLLPRLAAVPAAQAVLARPARCSAWRWTSTTRDGPAGAGRGRRARLHAAVAGDDARASGATASATSRRTGAASPASGRTATGPRSTTTASGSCTAAPTTR